VTIFHAFETRESRSNVLPLVPKLLFYGFAGLVEGAQKLPTEFRTAERHFKVRILVSLGGLATVVLINAYRGTVVRELTSALPSHNFYTHFSQMTNFTWFTSQGIYDKLSYHYEGIWPQKHGDSETPLGPNVDLEGGLSDMISKLVVGSLTDTRPRVTMLGVLDTCQCVTKRPSVLVSAGGLPGEMLDPPRCDNTKGDFRANTCTHHLAQLKLTSAVDQVEKLSCFIDRHLLCPLWYKFDGIGSEVKFPLKGNGTILVTWFRELTSNLTALIRSTVRPTLPPEQHNGNKPPPPMPSGGSLQGVVLLPSPEQPGSLENLPPKFFSPPPLKTTSSSIPTLPHVFTPLQQILLSPTSLLSPPPTPPAVSPPLPLPPPTTNFTEIVYLEYVPVYDQNTETLFLRQVDELGLPLSGCHKSAFLDNIKVLDLFLVAWEREEWDENLNTRRRKNNIEFKKGKETILRTFTGFKIKGRLGRDIYKQVQWMVATGIYQIWEAWIRIVHPEIEDRIIADYYKRFRHQRPT